MEPDDLSTNITSQRRQAKTGLKTHRVAVVGTVNWVGVAGDLLRRAGLDARPLFVDRRWVPLRALTSRRCISADAVHMIWGGDVLASLTLKYLLGKRLVWHWIGSDAVRMGHDRGLRSRMRRYLADQRVVAHFADSPELAKELGTLGIRAEVCRLLPASIEAEVMPLPDRFCVLSYWFDDRRTFYGGDMILQLARELPDLEFIIAGAEGKGAPRLPNVTFLGRLKNLEDVYPRVSVFLRLPEHDSLSAMVLESLARGRYVIYNKDFPHCLRADTLEQVRSAMQEIRRLSKPNRAGAAFVRKNFSLQREAECLRRVYGRILADPAL